MVLDEIYIHIGTYLVKMHLGVGYLPVRGVKVSESVVRKIIENKDVIT